MRFQKSITHSDKSDLESFKKFMLWHKRKYGGGTRGNMVVAQEEIWWWHNRKYGIAQEEIWWVVGF